MLQRGRDHLTSKKAYDQGSSSACGSVSVFFVGNIVLFKELKMASVISKSTSVELDLLLHEVGKALQLTDSQHANAEEKYNAVGRWLSQPNSSLACYRPEIYPQGSMLLQTTVKPLLRDEYDLDLVCLLNLDYLSVDPMAIYDAVAKRLRAHDIYRKKLELLKRCLRLGYAGEFHLDILPACPDTSRGGTCIWVPDRELKLWTASNPKGYAAWFNDRASTFQIGPGRRDIQPVPGNEGVTETAPLKLAVQLIKRHRDIRFDSNEEGPRSIVLATLAAHHYQGQELVSDSISSILDKIVAQIENTPTILQVPNPTNSAENFGDAWTWHSYKLFVDFIYRFRKQFRQLVQCEGLDNSGFYLNELFGEEVSTRAIKSYVDRTSRLRESGQLHVGRVAVGLGIATSGTSPVRGNTFFGK